MAYEKYTWHTGEVITEEKLNHIENGIADNDTAISSLKSDLGYNFIDLSAVTPAAWSSLVVKEGITLEKDNTYRFSIFGEGDKKRFLILVNSNGEELIRYNQNYDGYFDYTPEETLTDCYLDYRSNVANAHATITVKKITGSMDGLYASIPEIVLGDEVIGIVGDTLQLFFTNFIIGDQKNYIVRCQCDIGKNYPNYYEVMPTAANLGNHALTVSVYLNNGALHDRKTINLKVVSAVNPSDNKNILCLGDSRMAQGQIPIEASRRLKGTSGVATTPEALALSNYTFTGRLHNADETVFWEGVSGHTWQSYLNKNANNPFYYADTDTVDFARYANDYCGGSIDIICILLGINTLLGMSEFNSATNYFIKSAVANLIELIHTQLPNAKIIISTEPCDSPNGGLGFSYAASGNQGSYNAYGFNYRILSYDKDLINYFTGNDAYDYVKIASTHAQFQCEYAFPTVEKAVNTRSTIMETLQNNGVHPNNTGYWQLSDAFVFRAVLGLES